MDLLLLVGVSMRPVQFVKESAGVAERGLTLGTLTPEDGVVRLAIVAGEVAVGSHGTGPDICRGIRIFAGFLVADNSTFSLQGAEMTIGFVVETTCVTDA
jgi:hypothetical protein